jgi:uncharacterized membrane protein YkvA (DUF1232 family)
MFDARTEPRPSTGGALGDLARYLRLVWKLLRDGRVPGWVKALPVLGFLYLLSPIDLVPGWLVPGLGQLDDLGVILLSLKLLVDLSPPALVDQYRNQLFGQQPDPSPDNEDAIDASYRVVDETRRP